jgi:hypothetical protein
VLTRDVVDPWWKEKNTMYFLDPKSGAVQKTVPYNGRYEPVMAVFH